MTLVMIYTRAIGLRFTDFPGIGGNHTFTRSSISLGILITPVRMKSENNVHKTEVSSSEHFFTTARYSFLIEISVA